MYLYPHFYILLPAVEKKVLTFLQIMAAHPDHKYIEALTNNDSVLIDEIYRRYAASIKKMVVKNSGTETDAADLFQDVLIELHRKATQQNFVLTCPFEAFLFLVCRNRWINELHKRKGHHAVTISGDEGFDINEDVVENYEILLILEKRKDLIENKLAELGDGCRNLLSLSLLYLYRCITVYNYVIHHCLLSVIQIRYAHVEAFHYAGIDLFFVIRLLP